MSMAGICPAGIIVKYFECKATFLQRFTLLMIIRRFPHHFRTRFYVRESDYKAKMVCEWPEGRKRPAWGCAPLSELHVVRKGPILYLCRPCPGEGTSVAWAILKFQTIECKSLFCSFFKNIF